MKIKLNQPASINGGAFNFQKGDIIEKGDVPEWVFDLLLGGGYADEVKPRKKKAAEE